MSERCQPCGIVIEKVLKHRQCLPLLAPCEEASRAVYLAYDFAPTYQELNGSFTNDLRLCALELIKVKKGLIFS